jgi:hypothetical protein
MTDEIKLNRDMVRGSKAKQLLENELLTEAFDELEKSYFGAWRQSTPMDVNAREKLYLAANIVAKVKDHLGLIVKNGKIAEAELKQLTDQAERKKRFGLI